MKPLILQTSLLACAVLPVWASPVVLENAFLRYSISADGRNLAFLDRTTGVDYLRTNPPSPAALVRAGGRTFAATAAILTDQQLTLQFDDGHVTAVLEVETPSSGLVLTVASVSGEDIESLTFLNVPLTLRGKPD